ncbi:MAG: hypothetical protein HQ521_01120 [Bacteroidetes bacterium]|nr:hypothetical protein [Bacteroidota bacterium]
MTEKGLVDHHEYLIIPAEVNQDDNIVKVELEGDRRLVILETSFDQK